MIAVHVLSAHREHAMNTLQQLIARHRSIMDAVKMLWEHRVEAVGTLCTRNYWQRAWFTNH